MIFYITIFIF